MSDMASDEKFLRERGFGQRLGFGAQPALIVIDLINAFTEMSPFGWLGWDARARELGVEERHFVVLEGDALRAGCLRRERAEAAVSGWGLEGN
jgi:hypothetical protein